MFDLLTQESEAVSIIDKLNDHPLFSKYESSIEDSIRNVAKAITFDKYKNSILQVNSKFQSIFEDTRNDLGMSKTQQILVPPFTNAIGSEIASIGKGDDDPSLGPDPSAGVVHLCVTEGHSDEYIARGCAIDIPCPRIIQSIDLTVLVDAFTWATRGRLPAVFYQLMAYPGKDGPINIQTRDKIDWSWEGGLTNSWPRGAITNQTQTFEINIAQPNEPYPAHARRVRLELWIGIRANLAGVNSNHSGGGIRTRAEITKITST